jgi:hypothetical protein
MRVTKFAAIPLQPWTVTILCVKINASNSSTHIYLVTDLLGALLLDKRSLCCALPLLQSEAASAPLLWLQLYTPQKRKTTQLLIH